jgi:hypothetical protein
MHMPWQMGTLADWSIVGMNHYMSNGVRYLFVAMTHGEWCIKAEGPDTTMLWDELRWKAKAYAK